MGTAYEGWQSQRKGCTVQEVLEKQLSKILKEKVDVHGCSRTDSGVHAREFVAHFKTNHMIKDDKIVDALNFHLPKDIVIFEAKTVKDDFHARFSAKSKIYRYSMWTGKVRPLFEAPFVHWHPIPLDMKKMQKAAQALKGEHDFAAFMDSQAIGVIKDSVREIYAIKATQSGSLLEVEIEGSGFLRYMVRIIAGTLSDIGRGRKPANAMPGILKSKDRKKAGPTLPAQGLSLIKVKY